jgi:hypothetical protein
LFEEIVRSPIDRGRMLERRQNDSNGGVCGIEANQGQEHEKVRDKRKACVSKCYLTEQCHLRLSISVESGAASLEDAFVSLSVMDVHGYLVRCRIFGSDGSYGPISGTDNPDSFDDYPEGAPELGEGACKADDSRRHVRKSHAFEGSRFRLRRSLLAEAIRLSARPDIDQQIEPG